MNCILMVVDLPKVWCSDRCCADHRNNLRFSVVNVIFSYAVGGPSQGMWAGSSSFRVIYVIPAIFVNHTVE